jgi:hypothetical protein
MPEKKIKKTEVERDKKDEKKEKKEKKRKKTKNNTIKMCYEHHMTPQQTVDYLRNSRFETTLSYVKEQFNNLDKYDR